MSSSRSDLESLFEQIHYNYSGLSKRLQQIATFALDHPHDVALETVAVLAQRAGVQPSALIRFAKAFGFSGFSQMQRVFRASLAPAAPTYTYLERVRSQLNRPRVSGDAVCEPAAPYYVATGATMGATMGATTPAGVLLAFADAGAMALERLVAQSDPDALTRAVDLLATAHDIHLLGQRRAFPVAAFLAYALGQLGRRAQLHAGLGGMGQPDQARLLGPTDLLVAVSFHPYTEQVTQWAEVARQHGAAVLALTDSPVAPIARVASVSLEVREAQVRGFRSLTATLCLAQSLVVALAFRLEGTPPPEHGLPLVSYW